MQLKRYFRRHFDIFYIFPFFLFASFLATCQIISLQHQSRPLEQVSPVGHAAFWQIQLSQKGDFAHWLQKKLPLSKKYRKFLETRGKKSPINIQQCIWHNITVCVSDILSKILPEHVAINLIILSHVCINPEYFPRCATCMSSF